MCEVCICKIGQAKENGVVDDDNDQYDQKAERNRVGRERIFQITHGSPRTRSG